MRTTNLGDSGYVIYTAVKGTEGDEAGKVVLVKKFRSEEQQYSFNFPYQCGTGCELPWNAFDNEHEVTAGKDFVVMGTDGLFDNLYDKDIEGCLQPGIKLVKDDEFELSNPEEVANCMAKKAYTLGKDGKYMSPFARGAFKSGYPYPGGKEDDITVIVSQIVRK